MCDGVWAARCLLGSTPVKGKGGIRIGPEGKSRRPNTLYQDGRSSGRNIDP